MAESVYKCKKCGKDVKPMNRMYLCCGILRSVPSKPRNRRLHGFQPGPGNGAIAYRYGVLTYVDDGNGNVFDADDDPYEEYE